MDELVTSGIPEQKALGFGALGWIFEGFSLGFKKKKKIKVREKFTVFAVS